MGGKQSLKQQLLRFKVRAAQELPIERLILFGSRAKGKTGRDRDVDLVIVSAKFRTMDFFERGAKMYDYWTLNYPVDFLCYTPEEFRKLRKQISIVAHAVREGIEI